jgi:hypothetical protein
VFADVTEAKAYLDAIPYRQAAHYRVGRLMPVQFAVVHSMESSEHSMMAEQWQAATATWDRISSVNFGVDDDSTRSCVHITDTAYHCASGNRNTVGVEHTGRAAQTSADWLDPFSKKMLTTQSAPLYAALSLVTGIPVRRASVDDYVLSRTSASFDVKRQGGLLGHIDVTLAAQRLGLPNEGHWDPGPNFPWTWFINEVASHLPGSAQEVHAMRIVWHPDIGTNPATGMFARLLPDNRTVRGVNGAMIRLGATGTPGREVVLPFEAEAIGPHPTATNVFLAAEKGGKRTQGLRFA